MKKSNTIFLLLIGTLIMLGGCSSSKGLKEIKDISVDPVEVHAWIDMMPGKPSAVHFSGVLKIQNNSGQELKELDIKKIKVSQTGRLVYSFKPVFSASSGISRSVLPGAPKLFKFNTVKGLKRTNELNIEDPVSAVMSFGSGNKYFIYSIDSLKIEKVY